MHTTRSSAFCLKYLRGITILVRKTTWEPVSAYHPFTLEHVSRRKRSGSVAKEREGASSRWDAALLILLPQPKYFPFWADMSHCKRFTDITCRQLITQRGAPDRGPGGCLAVAMPQRRCCPTSVLRHSSMGDRNYKSRGEATRAVTRLEHDPTRDHDRLKNKMSAWCKTGWLRWSDGSPKQFGADSLCVT